MGHLGIGRPSGQGPRGGVIVMRSLFELADLGVRVIFVPCLVERWLYLTAQRLLLLDEQASERDQAEARREVLAEIQEL